MQWPMKRLDSLFNIARGGSPRPIKKFITDSSDGVNWIKIGDASASSKYIYETKEKITSDGVSRSRLVKPGDFILSNSMSFGRPYIMRTTGCIHDGWLVLAPKGDSIDQDFLYYILSSPFVFSQFDALAAGSTVRNLNIELVSKVMIPIMPIEIQKQIVETLNRAFIEIENAADAATTNLANAKELFDSCLQQSFSSKHDGWVTTSLKSITSKIGSGATPKGGKAAYKSEGMSLIRSMNVHDRQFKEKDLALIDNEQASKLNNVELFDSDVLLNITGASVARCCVVPKEYLPARVNQHVSIIRVNKNTIKPELLCYLLTSKYYKDILLGIGEAGSTRQAITKTQIENFEISYPKDFDSQSEFIKQLSALENNVLKLQAVYQQKLESLDELKKSILQKAFTGELTKSKGVAA